MGRAVSLFVIMSRWIAYLGVAFLGVAMVVTVADVVLRAVTRIGNQVFETPIGMAVPGVVDLVQLCVMGAVFMSIPFAFMVDAHVSVDLLTARLGGRRESVFKGVGAILSAAFMVAVLVYGWEQAQMQIDFGDSSSTLEIPMLWFWVFLLMGAGLSVLATVLLGVQQLLISTGLSSHAEEAPHVAPMGE